MSLHNKILLFIFLLLFSKALHAQIGNHRNDFSIGVNGGYVLSNIGFNPTVEQSMHKGMTGGVSLKYVCEKYFSTICSVYAEVNYASIGWKQDIKDINDQSVINSITGLPEEYQRTINYIQVPIFAHLGWGQETQGMQFFFQVGPQFGFYLNEKTESNYDAANRNTMNRASSVIVQENMAVENKFDYGIAGGIGVEYSIPKVGHFLLEGRYYYGLGNIYGNSKRDYFGRSNHSNIVIKMTYLFDITRTKKYY